MLADLDAGEGRLAELEKAAREAGTRYDEAAATGAKTLAVGCPFCMTMMTDAANKAGDGTPGGSMVVKDVAELVAERLVK